jgi:hypothetical protein
VLCRPCADGGEDLVEHVADAAPFFVDGGLARAVQENEAREGEHAPCKQADGLARVQTTLLACAGSMRCGR